MKYDNCTPSEEIITQIYSSQIFDLIQEDSQKTDYSLKKLKSKVIIECVRQTNQSFYAIFRQDDGKKVFVFANKNGIVYAVLRFDSFFSESDFSFVEIGKTTIDEVLNYDANSIVYPVSAVTVTGHILNNGVMIIQYSRFQNGVLLPVPIVSDITVIEDSVFETKTDDFYVSNTPYILPIDRAND